MSYKATDTMTPEQFTRFRRAIDNCPKRLYAGTYQDTNSGPRTCAVVYLGLQAGLPESTLRYWPETVEEVSRIYDISTHTLQYWGRISDWLYLFRPRRRAKAMKKRFENFLKGVKVRPEPAKTNVDFLNRELYETVQQEKAEV